MKMLDCCLGNNNSLSGYIKQDRQSLYLITRFSTLHSLRQHQSGLPLSSQATNNACTYVLPLCLCTLFFPALFDCTFQPSCDTHCQECYQNSVLFSQFLLTLGYTNNFTLLLFNLLTISDLQRKQETRVLVSLLLPLIVYTPQLSSYSRPISVSPSQKTSGDSALSLPTNSPNI